MAPNRQGGQLQIATDIERRAAIPDVTPSGMGQALAQAGNMLGNMADRVGQMADRAAQNEATEVGKERMRRHLAGLDPEFRLTKENTIYGRAFDEAALQVAETKTRQAMLADIDAIYDQHQASPGDLKAALNEKRGKWLAGSFPELRADLEVSFDGAAFSAMRQATRNHIANVTAEQKAAMQGELELSLKGLHQKAFALGLDAEADKVLGSEVARLTGVLNRRDPTGQPLIGKADAARLLLKVEEEVTTARIRGAFERLPTANAKREFLKTFKEDFAASRGAAKTYDLNGFEQVRGHLQAELRRLDTESNVAARAVLSDIKSVGDRAKKGFAAPPEELAAIEANVAATADPALAAAFTDAKDVLAFQNSVRGMAPAELDATVRALRDQAGKSGASERLADRIAMAEGVLDTMRTEIKQDPLGWAERSGRVSKVAPLDFSSAATASASLKARIAQADTIAKDYGIEPQYLRPDELRSLAVTASRGGDETLQVATAIAEAAGEKAPRVLAEVFKEAPVAGMIGGLTVSVGLTPAAQDAAAGLALKKTDGFKARGPSPNEARMAASEVLGTAFAELPRSEAAAIETASAIYEVRALRRGLTDFDAELWQGALAEALGAREIGGEQYGGLANVGGGWLGGGQTVLVPPDVKTDGIADLVASVRLEDLDPMDRPFVEDGTPAGRAELARATMKSAGAGQYFLALGDPDGETPDWIVDGNGDRYVLDLEALKPVLKKRRPDLYLGGR
jgi:hypothetical protein